VLLAARVDCAVVANNHVLDFGERGLLETLEALRRAGIRSAGAGRDENDAEAATVLPLVGTCRLVIVAFGFTDSGVPPHWAADPHHPGVGFLPDFSDRSVARVARSVEAVRRPGDVVVASLHWGSNWGYEVPASHRGFAHGLIDRAGVHVVHGHSSHHPRCLEVYKGHLIVYGCGDFLDDYEGILGYEEFRGDLVLMYFPTVAVSTGTLLRLEMTPLRIRRFRLEHPPEQEVEWLRRTFDRECRRNGGAVSRGAANRLVLT
jgi:poly-gamma-glutamate synthesis protein (capsule biosynthesis protein)